MSATDTAAQGHSAPRFYRPELDALRFLAFLLVFVEHTLRNASLDAIVGSKHLHGPLAALAHGLDVLGEVGNFGMCLFFLLSAFLITELLLLERERTGHIELSAFYVRRILRIWPLYFGFLAFCFFLGRVGSPEYLVTGKQIGYFALLSGNWYLVFGGPSPLWVIVLWSISVEEQFYLVWPWLVRAGKGIPGVCTGIALFTLSSIASVFWLSRAGAVNEESVWLNSFPQFLYFAVGAGLALWVHHRKIPMLGLGHRLLLLMAAFAVWGAAEWAFGIRHPDAYLTARQIFAGYSSVAIGTILVFIAFLGVSATRVPQWLRTLGKISYGLYVFHELFLNETEHWLGLLAHRLHLHGFALGGLKLLVAPLAIVVTIAIAWLSYRYFESPFLRLRRRFTIVASRPV